MPLGIGALLFSTKWFALAGDMVVALLQSTDQPISGLEFAKSIPLP